MDTLESIIELTKDAVGDSGTCSDSMAIAAINKARRILWNKAENRNTCEYLCIQCVEGCITLPSRYEKVLLAWANGHPMRLSDEWYQSYNGVGLFRECDSCHKGMQEIGGDHVVFRNYTEAPYLLGVMAERQEDRGVKMTFEVTDKYNSHHLMEVELSQPPELIFGDRLITSVIRVSKPKTQGRVRLYAYNKTNGEKLLLSVFAPWDTNPTFRRFGIGNVKVKCLTIYALKKYFDLHSKGELVEYTSDAIYFALLAINARENRNPDDFVKNMSLAVQEAKKEIENEELDVANPLNLLDFNRVEPLERGFFFNDAYSGFGGNCASDSCLGGGSVPTNCRINPSEYIPPPLTLTAGIEDDELTISPVVGGGTYGAYVLYYFVNETMVSATTITEPGTYPKTVPVNPDWLTGPLVASVRMESIPPLPTYTVTKECQIEVVCSSEVMPTGDYIFEISRDSYLQWTNAGTWNLAWNASGGEEYPTGLGPIGDIFSSPPGYNLDDIVNTVECDYTKSFTPLPVTTTYYSPAGGSVVPGNTSFQIALELGIVGGRYYAGVTVSIDAGAIADSNTAVPGTNLGSMLVTIGGYLVPMETRWNLAYSSQPGYVNTIVFNLDLTKTPL